MFDLLFLQTIELLLQTFTRNKKKAILSFLKKKD